MLQKLRPDAELSYIASALAYMNMADFDIALDEVESGLASKTTPAGKAQLYTIQGMVLYRKGDYDRAEQAYDLAVTGSLDSPIQKLVYPSLYRNQAVVAFVKGDTANARLLLEKALAIQPDDQSLIAALAVIAHASGDVPEALKLWQSVSAKETKFMDATWISNDYYKWSPKMADVARQIITELQNQPAQ